MVDSLFFGSNALKASEAGLSNESPAYVSGGVVGLPPEKPNFLPTEPWQETTQVNPLNTVAIINAPEDTNLYPPPQISVPYRSPEQRKAIQALSPQTPFDQFKERANVTLSAAERFTRKYIEPIAVMVTVKLADKVTRALSGFSSQELADAINNKLSGKDQTQPESNVGFPPSEYDHLIEKVAKSIIGRAYELISTEMRKRYEQDKSSSLYGDEQEAWDAVYRDAIFQCYDKLIPFLDALLADYSRPDGKPVVAPSMHRFPSVSQLLLPLIEDYGVIDRNLSGAFRINSNNSNYEAQKVITALADELESWVNENRNRIERSSS